MKALRYQSSMPEVDARGRLAKAAKYVVVLLILISLPTWVTDYYMLLSNMMLINATAVLGLVVLLGWSGQFSFSSATFVGIGAYSGGRLASLFENLPLEAALLIGTLAGAVVGLLFGLLAVRVRRYYMAIVTIAFMYLCELLERQGGQITGGVDGFLVPESSARLLGFVSLDSHRSQYIVSLAILALVFILTRFVQRTAIARGWIALKVDDRFAQALGVNVYVSRLLAFTFASAIFALVGAWSTIVTQYASPEQFGFDMLISHFIFFVVGGAVSLYWSALAALILTLATESIRGILGLSELIFGGVLLASVLLMRDGLYGIYRKWTGDREDWV